MITLAETRRAYRGYAPAYDVVFGPPFQSARRRAIETANDRPGQHVLEIGVGTGLSLRHYRPDVQLTAIDVSSEMLARARRRADRLGLGARCRLLPMNAEYAALADDSFDVVVALFVASTTQNLARFGAELRRVCRPGGQIVLLNTFSTPGDALAPLGLSLARFAASLGFEPYFPLDRFIAETGLAVRRIESIGILGRLKLLRAAKS
jgi:phosphatidylethanolamine/phosphatidyl-N-methylethanolamine N-methyltransferase